MAPTNQYAEVNVLTTKMVSHDATSILVEAGSFTPMRWFYERAATSHVTSDDDSKPPRKKRRISPEPPNDAPDRLPPKANERSMDEILIIHRATLDLRFSESHSSNDLKTDTHNDHIDSELWAEEVAVSVFGIEDEIGGTNLRLAIPKSNGKGAVLLVSTDGIPTGFCDALRRMSQSGSTSSGHSRSRFESAATFRCALKRTTRSSVARVRLEASVSWKSGMSAFPAGAPVGKAKLYPDYELLALAFEDSARSQVDHSQPWTPHDFYDSVYVPDKNLDTKGLYDEVLYSDLYPFQQRAVSWMLEREGVSRRAGNIQRLPKSRLRSFGDSLYTKFADADGLPCYVSFLQGIISRTLPSDGHVARVSGGLLAEEMGLGKTVELLALVSLHRRSGSQVGQLMHDSDTGDSVHTSGATLIITPASILKQWKAELARHAPSLKVLQYDGVPSSHGKKGPRESDLLADLATNYDIVLATYQTLTKEVHFAEKPPEREMRHARKFKRKRSPLIQIQWWRICLDEAQMVESGVTAAARVACRLPRVHSWAVSGTPLRKNVQDILGLLIFLRYRPFSDNTALWGHLITNHRHLFHRLIGDLVLRHTKAQVRGELRLPPQKRVVLTVPFSAIEQQHYSTLFTEMCEEVGVQSDGSPNTASWDPEDPGTVEAMRTWLVRLRQTCLHPQVGGRNRRALGRGTGPLRTVAEVLEVMIEQNESSLRTEERAQLNAQLLRAHIIGNNRADDHRSMKAYEVYEQAGKVASTLLRAAQARLKLAQNRAAERGDDDSSQESTATLGHLRTNVRTLMQLQHVCTFFAATATFQIKSNESLTLPDSERFRNLETQEMEMYEAAKQLRRQILVDTSSRAEKLMGEIRARTTSSMLIHMPKVKDLSSAGGIENRRIVEKADLLFDVIRAQAQTIVEWRGKMTEYLLKPLVDEDEGIETTGDEYEDSTKQQDELYVYFDAVKAMQADLNTSITGEDASLIDHEVKTLMRDAKWYLDPNVEADIVVHAPELLLKLLARRNSLRARKDEVGSIRGLIQEARALQHSMEWQGGARSDAERALVQSHVSALNKIFTEYTKALSGLEKEVDLFRTTQNQRLEFYRQLQELSDAVAPYKEELDDELDMPALQAATAKEEQHTSSLAQLRTKHRFLVHLRDDSENHDTQRLCVICQCNFENGVLTVCGHQYCKECIHHWWSEHRTCPVCKKKLATRDFHNITYKPKELKAQEEVMQSQSPSRSSSTAEGSPSPRSSIYSDIDPKVMNEIKSIDLPASYGTKIDTLGRHLHWIREHDPGAKSIIFSQYREFLDVLGTALTDFRIGYSRLGRGGAVEKFRHDPAIDCLLLDAKTDSSGLTLVNAQNIFLTEPLLQTAVELQAIARVDRIGQTRPTTVWGYLINDTVEEAIYELSVARRLAHVQSRQQSVRQGKSRSATPGAIPENAIDAANSEELASAPLSKLLVAGKGGGEVVGNEDLWQCLFGKAQKTTTVKPSIELEREVDRHLRGEAAEQRRQDAVAGAL